LRPYGAIIARESRTSIDSGGSLAITTGLPDDVVRQSRDGYSQSVMNVTGRTPRLLMLNASMDTDQDYA